MTATTSTTRLPPDGEPVLDVQGLKTYLFTKKGVGRAVDGVSFTLRAGETLGLVGESGCGKSMTCLSIVRLNPSPSSRIVGGRILFRGADLAMASEREVRSYRGRHIAMILQDPMTALNPVFTVGEQIYEALRLRPSRPRGSELRDRATELLRLLRIAAPASRLSNYPHQLSGGMRQRVVGAIALSGNPEVIIADEPTTALDVTIQAAYLALLKDLQQRTGTAIIFVTHDFAVVARMCDRVAVMYAGKVVETADTRTLFDKPAHPYTIALLDSVPRVEVRVRRLYSIEGQPPSIFNPPTGCRFHPRCPLRAKLGDPVRCADEEPTYREILPGHFTACHFAEELTQDKRRVRPTPKSKLASRAGR